MVYKVIAAICFIPALNLMLEAGDTITSEELHDTDATELVAKKFLAEEPAAEPEAAEQNIDTESKAGRKKK